MGFLSLKTSAMVPGFWPPGLTPALRHPAPFQLRPLMAEAHLPGPPGPRRPPQGPAWASHPHRLRWGLGAGAEEAACAHRPP